MNFIIFLLPYHVGNSVSRRLLDCNSALVVPVVVVRVFLSFVAQGLTLGVYESMFLSLTAGFAVDYVVHFAHAYNESAAPDRAGKMRDSLTAMGVSVMSGAISTLMASMMLFVCSFNFFSTYGGFIFFVIFWSILWAMCFFPALMMTAGPSADEGDVSWLRKCHKPRHAAVTAAT